MPRVRVCCLQLVARDVDDRERGLEEALEAVQEASCAGGEIVVLPEAVYPGYVLDRWARDPASPGEARRVLGLFREKARSCGVYVALGLPLFRGGLWLNGAVLIAPDGAVLLEEGKRFLWHFDERWYVPGQSYNVAETPWGKVGLLVCADARNPDVVRRLVARGAGLLLDLANLTSSGKDPATLSNQQVSFMLPVRALENKVWIAMANKVGVENRSVVYCGRSGIYDPRGTVVASTGSERAAIVVADVELPESSGIAEDRFGDERDVCVAGCEVALDSIMTGVAQVDWTSSDAFEVLEDMVHQARLQGVHVLALSPCLDERHAGIVRERISSLSKGSPNVVFVLGHEGGAQESRLSSVLLRGGRELPPVSGVQNVAGLGCLAVMVGEEGTTHERARGFAEQGASVVFWLGGHPKADIITRSRAAENRVFVATARPGREGESLIASPDGAVLAQAFACGDQLVSSLCLLGTSREKRVVPGTHVLRSPR